MASNNVHFTVSTLARGEIELINRVHSHFSKNEPDKFYFFYQKPTPFSNFHHCLFSENGIQFDSSEKYMMYHKASKKELLFFAFQFFKETSCLKNYLVIMKQLRQFFKLQNHLNAKL